MLKPLIQQGEVTPLFTGEVVLKPLIQQGEVAALLTGVMYLVIEAGAIGLLETRLEEAQTLLIKKLTHLAEVRRPIKDHIQPTEAVALAIALTTEALREAPLLEVAEDLLAAQEDVDNH